jgi:hypothetical protein
MERPAKRQKVERGGEKKTHVPFAVPKILVQEDMTKLVDPELLKIFGSWFRTSEGYIIDMIHKYLTVADYLVYYTSLVSRHETGGPKHYEKFQSILERMLWSFQKTREHRFDASLANVQLLEGEGQEYDVLGGFLNIVTSTTKGWILDGCPLPSKWPLQSMLTMPEVRSFVYVADSNERHLVLLWKALVHATQLTRLEISLENFLLSKLNRLNEFGMVDDGWRVLQKLKKLETFCFTVAAFTEIDHGGIRNGSLTDVVARVPEMHQAWQNLKHLKCACSWTERLVHDLLGYCPNLKRLELIRTVIGVSEQGDIPRLNMDEKIWSEQKGIQTLFGLSSLSLVAVDYLDGNNGRTIQGWTDNEGEEYIQPWMYQDVITDGEEFFPPSSKSVVRLLQLFLKHHPMLEKRRIIEISVQVLEPWIVSEIQKSLIPIIDNVSHMSILTWNNQPTFKETLLQPEHVAWIDTYAPSLDLFGIGQDQRLSVCYEKEKGGGGGGGGMSLKFRQLEEDPSEQEVKNWSSTIQNCCRTNLPLDKFIYRTALGYIIPGLKNILPCLERCKRNIGFSPIVPEDEIDNYAEKVVWNMQDINVLEKLSNTLQTLRLFSVQLSNMQPSSLGRFKDITHLELCFQDLDGSFFQHLPTGMIEVAWFENTTYQREHKNSCTQKDVVQFLNRQHETLQHFRLDSRKPFGSLYAFSLDLVELPKLEFLALYVTEKPTILDLASIYLKCPALKNLAIAGYLGGGGGKQVILPGLKHQQLVDKWWGDKCRVRRVKERFPILLEPESKHFKVLGSWTYPKDWDIDEFFLIHPPPWFKPPIPKETKEETVLEMDVSKSFSSTHFLQRGNDPIKRETKKEEEDIVATMWQAFRQTTAALS